MWSGTEIKPLRAGPRSAAAALALFNLYGVIAVNPDKNPNIKNDLANQFIEWIISLPVQEKIQQFGVEDFGQSLFTPESTAWREAHPTTQ